MHSRNTRHRHLGELPRATACGATMRQAIFGTRQGLHAYDKTKHHAMSSAVRDSAKVNHEQRQEAMAGSSSPAARKVPSTKTSGSSNEMRPAHRRK